MPKRHAEPQPILHFLSEDHFLRVIPLVRKRLLAGRTLIVDLGNAGEELALPIIGGGIGALGADVGRAGFLRGNRGGQAEGRGQQQDQELPALHGARPVQRGGRRRRRRKPGPRPVRGWLSGRG